MTNPYLKYYPELRNNEPETPWIIEIPKFLSDDECDSLWEYRKLDNNPHRMRSNYRKGTRWVVSVDKIQMLLTKKLKDLLPIKHANKDFIEINSFMRFVRQNQGDLFKHHQDISVCLPGKETLLTIIIYLSAADSSTNFYDNDLKNVKSIKTEKGKCIIFPHRIEHSGAFVESGTKNTLRTDVFYSL